MPHYKVLCRALPAAFYCAPMPEYDATTMQEQFIRSFDGTAIYVEESGSGLPVVLCDGLGCDGFIWRYLRPALVEHYRVIHWHYRGHGLSESPKDTTAIDVVHLLRDLEAVLEACHVRRAAFLGHSMGSQLLLDFALQHPEKVQAMVSLCGGPGHPLQTFHNTDVAQTIVPKVLSLSKRYPKMAQTLWSRSFSSSVPLRLSLLNEVNATLVQTSDLKPYFDHLASMDIDIYLGMLECLNAHGVEDRLNEIDVPVLIVAGERDTFTPALLSHDMHAQIPQATLVTIRGGSHIAPLEAPELIELRVLPFLKQHMQAPALR